MLQAKQSHIGPTELAKLLGVSRQSIYRAEKYQRIHREPNGLFDLDRVRRDWLNNSDKKMGAPSIKLPEPEPLEHPALGHLQAVWAHSLNDMAQVLRDVAGVSPETAYRALGIMFLHQWGLVAEANDIPEDQTLIEFTGPMRSLMSEEGSKTLGKWLNSQPVIDWNGQPRERVVNGKTLAGFNEGGSSHAQK